jgi:hypothetical protein
MPTQCFQHGPRAARAAESGGCFRITKRSKRLISGIPDIISNGSCKTEVLERHPWLAMNLYKA